MRTALSTLLALLLALSVTPAALAEDSATATRVEIISDRAEDPATIVIQVFKPAGASTGNPVPVVLEGHGWGGSRRTSLSDGTVQAYLDAGYGMISIDQRGFGESFSAEPTSAVKAGAMDPDNEGWDLVSIMDYVAAQEWVALEDDPASPFDRDPVVGAIGGSYGGGYQFLLAMMETREYGATRLDALAPEITWYDLNDSLAPSDTPRTAWSTLLYAVAVNRVEDYIHSGFAYGASTGMYADGTVPGFDLKGEFASHGPSGFRTEDGAQLQLDVPVLLRQGFSDNLFNFNQAWHNFHDVLTPEARAQSTLVGYNGGHALPNVLPPGSASGSDACSGEGGFGARTRDFFAVLLKGAEGSPRVVGAGQPLHYTTVDGACVRLDEAAALQEFDLVELDPTGSLGSAAGNTAAAGAPVHFEIAGTDGIAIGGVPTVDGDLYSTGGDARVFLGLSIGTSPTDATIIQNNVLPLRVFGLPATGGGLEGFELPGVAAELEPGEKLFLTLSPVSDMYFGHGSRLPGFVGLSDLVVNLPVIGG